MATKSTGSLTRRDSKCFNKERFKVVQQGDSKYFNKDRSKVFQQGEFQGSSTRRFKVVNKESFKVVQQGDIQVVEIGFGKERFKVI